MPATTNPYGYQLVAARQPLERHELQPLEPGPDEVVVEVAGRVVAAGEQAADWNGREVIVPAVIPCGACPACAGFRFSFADACL